MSLKANQSTIITYLKTFNKMTTEEKAAHDELIKTIKSQIEAADKTAEIEALKTKLSALESKNHTPEDYETVKAELVKITNKLTAMEEKPAKEEGFATLEGAIKAALVAKKSEIDEIVKNGGKQSASLEIVIKSPIDMGVGNTIGSGSTQVTITQNTGIISPIRKRELRYLAEVSVGSIGTSRALWIEETDEQGNPIFIAEGAGKTQLSVKYVEKTEPVKKIAVFGKVTTEMMADLPQLISYIQNNIMKRLDIKTETDLFTGDGIGENIKGLSTFATAFSAGSLALAIPDANELDVIEAVALQVKVAFGEPKSLFIHPSTLSKIKLIKDSEGRPIWKDYVTTNGMMNVSGLNLIETIAVTAGEFIGGDTTVANVLFRSEMGIVIGLDGNDFTNNKKTMLAEKRLVQFVSANDAPVLVKGVFATAITAINKV
jgi:HK97 family phage major capsid protein